MAIGLSSLAGGLPHHRHNTMMLDMVILGRCLHFFETESPGISMGLTGHMGPCGLGRTLLFALSSLVAKMRNYL